MKLCVIGTGYVGLVTGACLADIGHHVVCVDNNKEKIKRLKNGKIPIYEPGLDKLVAKNFKAKRISFGTSIKEGVNKSEIIFICVGTPPRPDGKADLSYVEQVAIEIAQAATKNKIVVEKSTVPVMTGDYVKQTLDLYKKNNVEFQVVSNPEFLREGSAISDFTNPDRIVIGTLDGSAKAAMLKLYEPMKCDLVAVDSLFPAQKCSFIIVTDRKSAELIKHASNTFLALKISYINLVAQICEKVGADVKEVALGMGLDNRIGRSFLDAGLGYGGSCFPKDVKAFIEIGHELGADVRLLEEIENINTRQRQLFFEKIKNSVWNMAGKSIGILGLSFKPNTDDMREAPAISIIDRLLAEGAKITAYDPAAMELAKNTWGAKIKYAANPYETAKGADALVILTEWTEFKNMDLKKIKKLLKLPKIVDGRNIFDPRKMKEMGFDYICVGRS